MARRKERQKKEEEEKTAVLDRRRRRRWRRMTNRMKLAGVSTPFGSSMSASLVSTPRAKPGIFWHLYCYSHGSLVFVHSPSRFPFVFHTKPICLICVCDRLVFVVLFEGVDDAPERATISGEQRRGEHGVLIGSLFLLSLGSWGMACGSNRND
jgi:hypothetical protein